MTHYVAACCSDTVAEVEVSDDGQVTIAPPAGEDIYRVQAPPRIEDPALDPGQMQLEYAARDRIQTLVMKFVAAADHLVSEAIWAHHSTWIIRCRSCSRQLEVADSSLPRIARVLAAGDWRATGGVVPLEILCRIAAQNVTL